MGNPLKTLWQAFYKSAIFISIGLVIRWEEGEFWLSVLSWMTLAVPVAYWRAENGYIKSDGPLFSIHLDGGIASEIAFLNMVLFMIVYNLWFHFTVLGLP